MLFLVRSIYIKYYEYLIEFLISEKVFVLHTTKGHVLILTLTMMIIM